MMKMKNPESLMLMNKSQIQLKLKIRNLKEEVKDENVEYGISDNDE